MIDPEIANDIEKAIGEIAKTKSLGGIPTHMLFGFSSDKDFRKHLDDQKIASSLTPKP